MKPRVERAARRAGRPAPAEAGANLLLHDLKNVAGRLDALQQNLGRFYDDPLFKPTVMDVLDHTVSHLRRLVRDLRDHESRIVVKLKIDINAVLREALGDLRSDPRGRIELHTGFAELPPIWGDAFLLRSAFACAMQNAAEAMQGCGQLFVVTTCSVRRGRRRAVVEITDTGPGMSEAFARQGLFRPFATTKADGLGLGLYTIRQVARLHGGTLRILSCAGVGTRVRFYLPLAGA